LPETRKPISLRGPQRENLICVAKVNRHVYLFELLRRRFQIRPGLCRTGSSRTSFPGTQRRRSIFRSGSIVVNPQNAVAPNSRICGATRGVPAHLAVQSRGNASEAILDCVEPRQDIVVLVVMCHDPSPYDVVVPAGAAWRGPTRAQDLPRLQAGQATAPPLIHRNLAGPCAPACSNIENLEADQSLQDAVLSVHHAAILTMSMSPAIKIVENDRGVGS
jgi:hypothetical protein